MVDWEGADTFGVEANRPRTGRAHATLVRPLGEAVRSNK